MSSDPSSDGAVSCPVSRHFILGTAGHIDHGKTRLVEVLTGTNTDRLPEERRRGMTIELGFAELTLGDARFGVVDVPGHERFVRTMVAGATGMDLALIVVAADDSVMPQTREHVEILNLLGVTRAVVAITKTDLVDDDMVELVGEDIRALFAGSPLEAAPLCPVSAVTGAGIDELKQALITVASTIEDNPPSGPFRVAVDRVFSVPGRGTVVTGSALQGTVAAGDTLELWPGGETCRVRALQTHGVHRDTLRFGQRVAINLSGIGRDRFSRGSQLATVGYLRPSPMLDVRLSYLASAGRPLKSTSTVRLCIGTLELPSRVVLLEEKTLQPGAWSYAQLRCGDPVVTTYGERFIIRDETASRTIGGGIVLNPVARRRRRSVDAERERLRRLEEGNPLDRLEEVLRQTGFSAVTDLQLSARTGVVPGELPDLYERLRKEGRWKALEGTDACAVPGAFEDLETRLSGWLERFHENRADEPGRRVEAVLGWLERMTNRQLAKPLFDRLTRNGVVKRLGQFVCLPAFAPALSGADEKVLAEMLSALQAGGFQPPALDNLKLSRPVERKRLERLATLAVALGELVRVDAGLYLHAETERDLRQRVSDLIESTGGVTVAQVRETLQSTRKYVVPFLEYLDRCGVTTRVGDQRVLAQPSARP